MNGNSAVTFFCMIKHQMPKKYSLFCWNAHDHNQSSQCHMAIKYAVILNLIPIQDS